MDGMTINHIVSIDHGSWEDAEGFVFFSGALMHILMLLPIQKSIDHFDDHEYFLFFHWEFHHPN